MTLFNNDFVDYRSYEINVTDMDARKSVILCETSCIDTASAQYEAEKLYRERVCSMINGNEFTHEIFKIANKPGIGEINFGYWNGTIKNDKFVKMKFNVIWRVFMEYNKINFEVI